MLVVRFAALLVRHFDDERARFHSLTRVIRLVAECGGWVETRPIVTVTQTVTRPTPFGSCSCRGVPLSASGATTAEGKSLTHNAGVVGSSPTPAISKKCDTQGGQLRAVGRLVR